MGEMLISRMWSWISRLRDELIGDGALSAVVDPTFTSTSGGGIGIRAQ